MRERVSQWVILCIFLTLTVNFFRSWYALWQRGDILKSAKQEFSKAETENEELRRRLAQVQTEEFIERDARKRLNASKPDEITVILPPRPPIPSPTPTENPPQEIWRRWASLFY